MFGFKKQSEATHSRPSVPPPSRIALPAIEENPVAHSSPPRPPLPPAVETRKSVQGTHIVADTRVRGDIHSDSALTIAGEIDGSVSADGPLLIEASAKIRGDVSGDNIVISGHVEGEVRAKGKLTISSTGLVIGDIAVRSLNIDEGGTLQGQCRMGIMEKPANEGVPPPPVRESVEFASADEDDEMQKFMPDLASNAG
jgi:cytoskeletal protein CcmA (bactofilin family)